jgi:uncharacterized protein (DUF1501 family)
MLIKSRRNFLKTALGVAGGAAAFGKFGEMAAFAATPTNPNSGYQALVCIFLAGGNDGHNTVFPIANNSNGNTYGLYQGARQGLAMPSSGVPVIHNGNDVYGLHPSMPELGALYNSGAAAVVANVGNLVKPISRTQYLQNTAPVPAQLFSHSDQSTQWQTAVPNGSASTGWGGRVEDLMAGLNGTPKFSPITSTSGCGLFCSGQSTFPSTVPVGGVSSLLGATGNRLQTVQNLMQFDNGLSMVSAANAVYFRGVGFSQALNQAIASAKVNTVFPGSLIGQQLLTIAKIISIRQALGITRQVFFAQLGGFDFHTNELSDQASLLGQLSSAMSAFYTSTQELLVPQQVTTFTASEFGRTLQPNGSGGTDHAWGSHHFVMGGSVVGGKMYGTYPQLVLGGQDDANSRGTLIPTTSVSQYSATMANWFGVDPLDFGSVFPNLQSNFQVTNLGFLG